MAEQASNVSREAKGLQQGLKEALKTRDPWDKEIEFQRKNLRRQYLRLLLVHPFAKESKDAETHLWMQTSYAFISIYKQRLTSLDRALQSAPRHQPRQGGHGPVEYRKLMQRFRQFLAEEEKFWIQLIVRLRRSFGLDEAQTALVALGILPNDEPAVAQSPEMSEQSHQREAPTTNGRNHFQFPPEESTAPAPLASSPERISRLAILSKSMVCLGDIARYRELYNESGGRPKAGHEDSPLPARKNGRNKRGGAAGMGDIPRARNYDKSQQCYEQARLLVPDEGNPSHQLAILSSYQKDLFGSLVHYYRALCVVQPYDTASENLGTVLNKALDQWKGRMKREKETNGGREVDRDERSLSPRLRVENFKEKVLVLHALWRLGADKMESISPKHAANVLTDFSALVSERHLPIDTISKVIIIAEGALWKHRTIRDSTSPTSAAMSTSIESHIATHVLGLHRILLEIGLVELAESPPQDVAENDLAPRITATFRRTLPALRIAGKWLRANFKYVVQSQQPDTAKEQHTAGTIKKDAKKHLAIAGVPAFWEVYALFMSALYHSFPADRLPSLASPLEEDIDMRGFLPLRNLMAGAGITDTAHIGDGSTVAAQVHPNEEQLMRIRDLLDDAKALVGFENSPLLWRKTRFIARTAGSLVQASSAIPVGDGIRGGNTAPRLASTQEIQPDPVERDEETMTETSRTDDDPVRDAFRQVLDGSDKDMDEDDEDEIVWNLKAPLSPIGPLVPSVLPSPERLTPMSPRAPSFIPRSPPVVSQNRPQALSSLAAPPVTIVPTSTTAQDLLDSVMNRPVLGSIGDTTQLQHQQSTAPQPQLLFGSGPPNRPGHSIWSMSLDDSSPKYPNANAAAQPSRHYESRVQPIPRQSHEPSPNSWPSPYAEPSQASQNHLSGAFPSGYSPHHVTIGSHRRAPSTNVYSSQNAEIDAYGFSSGVPHQPYRSPNPNFAQDFVGPSVMAASTASGTLYPHSSLSAYLGPSLHHHDPRLGQAFAPAPVPQMWGNLNG